MLLPAVFWGMFVCGAAFSLINVPSEQLLFASRTLIDAFILPLMLGWTIYKSFRVREHLLWLRTVVCIVSIYLMIIGSLEMITGQDLLPQSGANGAWYAGEGLLQIVRPDGPYANTGTFSTVGMINLFLLLFFRRAMPKVPRSPFYWLGVVASIVVSLMTLTRGVIVAFAVILLIEVWRAHELKERILRVTCMLGLLAVIAIALAYAPIEVVQERSDSANFFARVAQQSQSFRIFRDHPFAGVGLTNFSGAAETNSRYAAAFAGVEAVETTHNFLAEVVVDTGLLGAIPFLISQILIFRLFHKLNTSAPVSGGLVYSYFIMIFAAFWVMNMDVGLGIYSDLTLWFAFALSILFKYAVETTPLQARDLSLRQLSFGLRRLRFAAGR
jgi:O-antigen ligase